MTSDADDVHCDSLTGACVETRALSVPPSLRPRQAGPRLRFVTWATAGALLAAALVAYARRAPDAAAAPEPLRVEGHTVSYSSGFAAQAGIRTMEIREAAFSPVIFATAKATFDPDQVAAVGASALGTVRRVAKYEGDNVKRGDVLAEIGSPLQVRMDAAASLRTREAPRGMLGVSVLRSPLDGVVVERRVVTGQSVRGERVVFVIANLDRLSIELSLDQAQARELRLGDRVELSRELQSGTLASGRVARIEAAGGAVGEKVAVRIGVDNRARGLRPGQAVSAKIFTSRGARVLVVPNRALAWIAGQPAVFVSDGHNSASAAPVTLGDCDGEQTEVRLGLASGQRIVSDGVPNLKEASFL